LLERQADGLLFSAQQTAACVRRNGEGELVVIARGEHMESRVKLLGHPVHPMLIVLPLGLFIAAVVFDALHLWLGSVNFPAVAYWNIAGGIMGGLLAAVFGLIDWLAIPSGTRAKRIGLLHGISNVIVVGLFAIVWWMRSNAVGTAPTTNVFLVEVGALVLGGVAGWLGGELVDRLGVGVDDGAHLQAPSSLSGRSAREKESSTYVPRRAG
jgi:uncharacterized membrane protein